MRIITSLANDGFPEFLDRVRLVERVGLHGIGVGDTPHTRDPYVSLTAAAMATSTIKLGPIVTNPATRHPATTASAISSLDDLSGGRAYLGFGSGDSAVRHRGLPPAGIAGVRSAMAAIRDLLDGQATTIADAAVGAQWTGGAPPLMLAADGPRSMRLAGEMASAALIGTGIESHRVSDAISRVREGEALAGRPVGSVKIWLVARTAIASEPASAYERLKMVLSVAANHVLHAEIAANKVPEELLAQARAYCHQYDYTHHGVDVADNRNVRLFESLGLRDYIVNRFGVVGDSASVATEFSRLARLGVHGVLVPAVTRDADELIRLLGEEVAPRVSTDPV